LKRKKFGESSAESEERLERKNILDNNMEENYIKKSMKEIITAIYGSGERGREFGI